ncbi:hypothetical protein ACFY0F_23735 [Streptomyces sp. NPDC001544]|uniref:zinc finger domain-containing protein n=1 Tax=Streptomyces sp. NPDC001544 TaxID=3364584 RepID=UPI0036A3809E
MNRPPAAPMPLEVRNLMRARQHPARAIDCPHCGAHDRDPCKTISGRRLLTEPHPARVSAWAQTTACCPDCQVEPTVPCHDEGRARTTVHDRRYQEAQETAA